MVCVYTLRTLWNGGSNYNMQICHGRAFEWCDLFQQLMISQSSCFCCLGTVRSLVSWWFYRYSSKNHVEMLEDQFAQSVQAWHQLHAGLYLQLQLEWVRVFFRRGPLSQCDQFNHLKSSMTTSVWTRDENETTLYIYCIILLNSNLEVDFSDEHIITILCCKLHVHNLFFPYLLQFSCVVITVKIKELHVHVFIVRSIFWEIVSYFGRLL